MAHMGLSNMFCIDLDRHGNGVDGVANFRRFLKVHGLRLPKTLTHLTPSGGLHTFYRQNPECHVPTSHGRLEPGIDILADRTLAMMPPTPGYRTRDDHPIAVAPIELARCIAGLTPAAAPKGRPDAVGGVVKHSISGVMQTLCNAPEGQRNSTLYWALNRVAEMPAGKHNRLIRQISREASHLGLPNWEIDQTIASVFGGRRG